MRTVVLLGFFVSSAPAADHWPAFRGPTGDGISTAKNIPTTWTETENVRWKVPVHGKGWSSPVVADGRVWLTTATEKGTEFSAICFDLKTGKTLHDLKLFTAEKPVDISQYNSFASPTPCLVGDRVFIHFGSFGTACLNSATAEVIWKRTDLPCDHWRGPASSPVVHDGKLFLLFDGYDKQYVACLDAGTGKTVWTKDRVLPYPDNGDLKKAYATPAVFEFDGKAQVVCSAAVGTIAYDVATGEEVWRVIHQGMNEACRPIHRHGLIYLTTGHVGNLMAVKAGRTGDLTQDGVAWKLEKIGVSRPSPLVVGDLLFQVNDTGVLYCLDAKTGQKFWQERLDGKFSASPVLADGHLFCVSENGKVFVVRADQKYTPVATNRLDVSKSDTAPKDIRCMASPAVVDGHLLIRTGTHLYCFGQ